MPKETACFRVTSAIREDIFRGRLHAGESLIEAELTKKYKVSRNTLREAFKQLNQQGLITQEPNKSVRIRRMTKQDMRDIYHVRRVLELSALDNHDAISDEWLNKLRVVIRTGEEAISSSHARRIGTYSLKFHQKIVELHQSARINEMFSYIVPQLRLIFVSGPAEMSFQSPWISREIAIWQLLSEKKFAEARKHLAQYLNDSEKYLLETYLDETDYTIF